MLGRLPDYFAWRAEGALTEDLQATLLDAYCSRYERVIQGLMQVDAPRAEDLADRFSRLPDEALTPVLMAPETGYRLGYDGLANVAATASYLEQALTAEDLRRAARSSAPEPVWSARGDRYFPGSRDDGPDGGPGDGPTAFDPARPYRAPELHGIVVDFASPRAMAKLVHIAGEATAIRPEDMAVALDRIGSALDLVERASAGAWRTLKRFTDVIVVRSDPSAPDHYTSASSTLCLRRPVLRNPFVERATVSELADGLVHEAIHCVCDIAEMQDGRWLVGEPAEAAAKVASPWTGRALDLHTYLQASWVWYGLWNFWLAAMESGAIEANDGARCLARAYRGFHDGAAVARLRGAAPYVRGDLLEALEEAQARVRAEASVLHATT